MRAPGRQRPKTIVVIGTMDTKGTEMAYLAGAIRQTGCTALLMDVGTHHQSPIEADLPASAIAAAAGEDIAALHILPRGEAVSKMSQAAALCLRQRLAQNQLDGVVGLGGSGGTTICAAAMRALPYGLPKLLVSTLASGNTRWHIDISDIVMMPSLLDIGGLNPMLCMVLNNAAQAIAGMAEGYQPFVPSGKKVVSFTMYGTTTLGVSRARDEVAKAGLEPWVFHASGVGGRTMEKFVSLGYIHAVADMTLAEVGAHIVGGLHDAGSDRLEAAGRHGLPQVIVPGAADTVVLPPRDQIPDKFRHRVLNFHNPTMTTMRTTPEENVAIASFIAEKLNKAQGPVVVLLPTGGLSSIDRPGKIFYDPQANAALFDTLKQRLAPTIQVNEYPHHIDDPEFAGYVGQWIVQLVRQAEGPTVRENIL